MRRIAMIAVAVVLGFTGSAQAQSCALPLTMSGTQYADCFTGLMRAHELQAGLDQGNACPGDVAHGGTFPYLCGAKLPRYPALNIVQTLQATATWLTRFDDVIESTGERCVDGLDVMANGAQLWGVFARLNQSGQVPDTGCFIAGLMSEGKGTDQVLVVKGCVTNMATGAVTYTTLAWTDMHGADQAYGGRGANGRCCSVGQPCWRGPGWPATDNACHANLQWVRACLRVETLSDGRERYTATAGLRGSGSPIDPSRANPKSPISQTFTAEYLGPRPAGIAKSGGVGIILRSIQGIAGTSVTHYTDAP